MSADAGPLRLVVRPPTPGGYARFLVLRDDAPPSDRTAAAARRGARRALLASGSEHSVPAAMQAAERVAARLAPRRGD